MTIQTAAIWGNVVGLVLRTVYPFLLEISKGKKKWTDWDWGYIKPALYGLIPAAGTTYGLPEWLAQAGVNPESGLFVPLIFAGCVTGAYVGQDVIREFMRPRRQVETPKDADAPTPGTPKPPKE